MNLFKYLNKASGHWWRGFHFPLYPFPHYFLYPSPSSPKSLPFSPPTSYLYLPPPIFQPSLLPSCWCPLPVSWRCKSHPCQLASLSHTGTRVASCQWLLLALTLPCPLPSGNMTGERDFSQGCFGYPSTPSPLNAQLRKNQGLEGSANIVVAA